MALASVVLALLLVYHESAWSYLRAQHYQEHFVYLWVFLAAALSRSLRGPFRRCCGWSTRRDRAGLAACLASIVLLWFGAVAGSNTAVRTSLVALVTGIAVLAVPRWTVKRCALHGVMLLLCFGFPYSVYFPVTSQLQAGVVSVIALPARLGLADYSVVGNVVVFPHYDLAITPDCSGLGQLLTFLGIAILGVASAGPRRSRAMLLLALGLALAWASNVARVAVFVGLVGSGWTKAVEDDAWHATIGFLVYLPFMLTLMLVILKTHVPLAPWRAQPVSPGRVPIAWLAVPLLAAHFASRSAEPTEFAEPPWFAGLTAAPMHTLTVRAASEGSDRMAYGTPWLLNARFVRDDDAWFDLLHYCTRSRSHLCVHRIADCLGASGATFRYQPPVEVDGRPWWRIDVVGDTAATSAHVYFAFEVGGRRCDDSVWTQLEVVRQRILFGSWDVQLTRVFLPGPLPPSPNAHALQVLTWVGRQVSSAP